jgi:hypothetical protein
MTVLRALKTVAGLLPLLAVCAAQAAPLVDTVKLIADTPAAAAAAPAARTFTVTEPGAYLVTLTDLNSPKALSAVSVAVANSTATAANLSAPGTANVTLAAGNYTVQPLATAASGSAGSFTVTVTPAGGVTPLFQNQWAIAPPAAATPPGQSLLSAQFKVVDPGSYTVEFTDQNFPAPLSSLQLTVALHGDPNLLCTFKLGSTPPCQLQLQAGSTYDLFVVAQADATALKGLYSLNIVGGSAATSVAYAVTQGTGGLAGALNVPVPAAGNMSVQLNDLGKPAPLALLSARVVQGATLLQAIDTPGSVSVSVPAAGTAQIFVLASPNASVGESSYAVFASQGASTLLDVAVPVVDAGHLGYAFSTVLTAAGAYQLTVNDFKLPAPLTEFNALAVQAGAALVSGTGATQIAAASNGTLNMLVFTAVPAANASGLFGVELTVPNTPNTVYAITQGVGAAFRSQTVDIISSGGSYVAQLTDLEFPAKFAQVWLIGTRGQSVVTQIIGGGKVVFGVPMSGTYVINILAQVAETSHYGLYGWSLDVAPPIPTVTLTSSASAVNSGESVTLTWSSTDATSCSATGGWSGTLATSGSQKTSALTANSTFFLTCTGDGGTSGAASVQVNITQPQGSSGGGGGIAMLDILALALVALWQARRRLNRAQMASTLPTRSRPHDGSQKQCRTVS